MDNAVEIPHDVANNSSAAPQSSMKSSKKSHSTLVASIALLTAMAAGIVTGVNWKKSAVEQKQLLYVQQHLRQQQQSVTNMSQQVSTLQTALQRQQSELTQTSNEVQRLTAQDPTYAAKQTLQEMEHIIREAQLNLMVSNNIPATLSLLQAADQRAQLLTLSGTHQLRELLAKNITALQMIAPVDSEGLIAKLAALQAQIDQIPIFVAPVLNSETTVSTVAPVSHTSNWRQGLRETWETLQKIIVIRHREEPVTPLLSPDEHLYLKQNLQLLLQQAIWAVMQRQDKVYQNSLQQAIVWIQQYYTSNQTASTALITSLQTLQKVDLRPPLPELMPLLQQIQQMRPETLKAAVMPDNAATGAKPAHQVGVL